VYGAVYSDGGAEAHIDYSREVGRIELHTFLPGGASLSAGEEFYSYLQFTDYETGTFFYEEQKADGSKLLQYGLFGSPSFSEQIIGTIGAPVSVAIRGNGFYATF